MCRLVYRRKFKNTTQPVIMELRENLKEHFGDLIDEETLDMLVRYARGEEVKFRVDGIVLDVGKNLKIRRGEEVYEISLECCREKFKPGYLVRVYSEIVRSERDFEIVGDVSKVIQGVFLGKNGFRFALAVEKSVWICFGDVDCRRGDVLELRGFTQEDTFYVLSYRILDRSEVKCVWTEIKDVKPLKIVNLRGRVSGLSGKFRRFAVIHISDESGRIRVVLFGENAELYDSLDVGDWVEIYNCYARIGYNGEIEVVCDEGLAIKVF